jgi:Uma2 family endonuclease
MVAPRPKLATFADLVALDAQGRDVRAEIINGELVEKEAISGEHGGTQAAMAGAFTRRYQRGPGGRWPGGWWFITEAEVQYEPHQIFCHDLAGWRRERAPQRPSGRPIALLPDWSCELISPSNEKRDRIEKFRVLHAHRVPHYWIADPIEQTLVVHRCEPSGYLVVLTATAEDVVRAEPFRRPRAEGVGPVRQRTRRRVT